MALLNESAQSYYSGNDLGGYQFISLDHVINNFLISHVGDNKIIGKAKRTDVAFHAQRALQEFSYDTLKSIKSQEITLPPSLTMSLPQDYVNYVKLTWVDSAGIEHIVYPTSKTSNPTNPFQNSDGDFAITAVGTFANGAVEIVLDSEYKNIIAGMRIVAPSIPDDAVVSYTSHTAGLTTVFIHHLPNAIVASQAGTETITFENQDGSLVPERESGVNLAGLVWSVGSNQITAASVADAGSVTVGMVIDNQLLWPLGVTVIDVNGAVITMSQDSLLPGSGSMTFIPPPGDSTTWSNYKSGTASENQDDYQDDTYWPMDGSRYGLDPQHAQANGSYYIDEISGKIHFSSNINGKTVILKYISDGLGTNGEMVVHKFAEEAMYKHIAYAMLSTRLNTPEQLVARFKKERFAETRKAKLRLSNIKIEELTQILRGKSKQIKH